MKATRMIAATLIVLGGIAWGPAPADAAEYLGEFCWQVTPGNDVLHLGFTHMGGDYFAVNGKMIEGGTHVNLITGTAVVVGQELHVQFSTAGIYTTDNAGAVGTAVLDVNTARWHERRENMEPGTQFNFVCTADIIGGNSGSPVVNRELELVGLIFDGNIQSLTGDYYFDDLQDRAVSVSSQAIRAALRDVYQARRIAEELGK